MELRFVGLGKMGMNMVERLRRDNHIIVAFDIDKAKLNQVRSFGAGGVSTLALPVIALSLFTRFRSRVDAEGRGSFVERLLAALHNEFGGHTVVENRD